MSKNLGKDYSDIQRLLRDFREWLMEYYTPDTAKVVVKTVKRFLRECGDFERAKEWVAMQGKSENYRRNLRKHISLLQRFVEGKEIKEKVQKWYDPLMDEFRAYLRTRGHRGKTLSTYPYQVGYFIRWLGAQDGDNLKVGMIEANKFMIHLAQRGLSNSGMASYLDALRAFYDFLVVTGRAEKNPFREIPRPKRMRREVRFLTKREVRRLLATAKRIFDLRRYLAIRLLYVTGMRVGELAELRWGDIDITRKRALVRGKTGERYVLLDDITVGLLLKLRKEARFSEKTARVFRVRPQTIREWVRRAGEEAGLGRITPHMLRHSFGTHLIQAGVHERVVQALLGHESIQSTMVYTHVRDEDLREAHKKLFLP